MLTEQEARDEVVRAARHLTAVGLSPGSSGNVSVRLGDRLLVTPTGSSLGRVQPDDLAVVPLADAACGTEVGDAALSEPRPSKEVPLHRAVYTRRPDAVAVVHLHSPYAVAAACLDWPDGAPVLPALTPYQVMRLGGLPVAPYARPGSPELAETVATLAGDHAAMLMANHGSLAAGSTLDSAVDLAEEIEAAARVALLVQGLPHRTLTPGQIRELR